MSPRALYARFLVLCACSGLGTLFVSLSARASAPSPPGFRTLRPWTPPPPSAAPRRSSLSLLDEAGRMLRPVPEARLAAWRRSAGRLKSRQQLHQGGLRRLSEAALAHLHLGEWELARAQQPAAALAHFRAARRLVGRRNPVFGLAAYDEGVTFFREGSYRQARDQFSGVLKAEPALKGFDRRTCSLFLRHASACYGYHQERERAGITEPKRLDPEGGAAGLAVCLRALQNPNSKSQTMSCGWGRGSSPTR